MIEQIEIIFVGITVVIAFAGLWWQNRKQNEDLGRWRGSVDARLEAMEQWRQEHEAKCHERIKGLHEKIDRGFERINERLDRLVESQHATDRERG